MFRKILLLFLTSSVFVSILIFFCVTVITSKGYNSIKKERFELKNNNRIGFISDEHLMYKAKPNAKYYLSEYSKKDADTNKLVTIDEFSRRITPEFKNQEKHALFFGCSYTYGDGLSDENTIPYLFEKSDSSYNAYNYALSGYGTTHMFELLKTDIQNDVKEDTGIALYFLLDHHKDRITYNSYTLLWGYDFPKYSIDNNNNLHKDGTFFKYRPIRTCYWKGFAAYKLWKYQFKLSALKSKFSKVSKTKAVHKGDDYKYRLMTKLINESRNLYESKFPKGKFYVVIFPGESTNVIPYLKAYNLDVVDISGAINLKEINGLQSDGYHPNKIGTKAIVPILLNQLN